MLIFGTFGAGGGGGNELASCPSNGSDIFYKFSSGFQTVTQTIFMWKFGGFENILVDLVVHPLLNKDSDRNYKYPILHIMPGEM